MIVEGKLFNWEKAPVYFDSDDPWVHRITLGNMGDCWSCIWGDGRLSISKVEYSSDIAIPFECDLELAEIIVMSFAKANKFEIMPLHKKIINNENV